MNKNKPTQFIKSWLTLSLFSIGMSMTLPVLAFTDTTNSNPFNPEIDLLQINDDVLGDPDGLMTKVADKMFLNTIGYEEAFLVVGTYSAELIQRFDDAGEGDIVGLMNTLYPNSQCNGSDCGKGKWLNADSTWALDENAAIVSHVAQLWKDTLDANPDAEVWIAEGGQGDFTLDVAKYAHENLGVSLSTLNNRVHTVQHAAWNIDNTTTGVYGFSNNPASEEKIGRMGFEQWIGPNDQRGELFDYVQVHYIQSGNGNSGLALRNDDDFLADKWEPRLESPYDSYWATMKESTGKEIDIVDFSDNILTLWIFNQYQPYFDFAESAYPKSERPLAFLDRFGQGFSDNNLRPTGAFVDPTPNNNLLAGDAMNVAVDAQDGDGVIVQVELFLNDITVGIDTNAPFVWDALDFPVLANLASGNYTLKATITDDENAQRTINRSVIVDPINTEPPSFVDPTPTAAIDAGDDVFIKVDATGSVDYVELFVNGDFVRRENITPYEWNSGRDELLASLPSGDNIISAVITNNNGNDTVINTTIAVNAQVEIENNAPTGDYITPTPDSVVMAGDSITVAVDAFDSDGVVEKAVLFIDDVRIAIDKEAPFIFSAEEYDALADLPVGSFELKVVLVDNDKARTRLRRTIAIQ